MHFSEAFSKIIWILFETFVFDRWLNFLHPWMKFLINPWISKLCWQNSPSFESFTVENFFQLKRTIRCDIEFKQFSYIQFSNQITCSSCFCWWNFTINVDIFSESFNVAQNSNHLQCVEFFQILKYSTWTIFPLKFLSFFFYVTASIYIFHRCN